MLVYNLQYDMVLSYWSVCQTDIIPQLNGWMEYLVRNNTA